MPLSFPHPEGRITLGTRDDMTQKDGYKSYLSLGVDARVSRVLSYFFAPLFPSGMCCIGHVHQLLLGKTPISIQDTPHDTSSTQS